MYPGVQTNPTSWDASYAPIQTGVPTAAIAPIAAQPYVATPLAYQQQPYPTMALDSLPTYR